RPSRRRPASPLMCGSRPLRHAGRGLSRGKGRRQKAEGRREKKKEGQKAEAGMRFVSTRRMAPAVSFREALLNGLAPDGGLYMPETLDRLPPESLHGGSLVEVGQMIGAAIIGDEVPGP